MKRLKGVESELRNELRMKTSVRVKRFHRIVNIEGRKTKRQDERHPLTKQTLDLTNQNATPD